MPMFKMLQSTVRRRFEERMSQYDLRLVKAHDYGFKEEANVN